MRRRSALYLYVIGLREQPGYFKIGITDDVERRIASFQIGNPFEVYPVNVYTGEGARTIEGLLHRRFAKKCIRGEWFNLDDQDLAILNEMVLSWEPESEPEPEPMPEVAIAQPAPFLSQLAPLSEADGEIPLGLDKKGSDIQGMNRWYRKWFEKSPEDLGRGHVDIDAMRRSYDEWYRAVYEPALRAAKSGSVYTITAYLHAPARGAATAEAGER